MSRPPFNLVRTPAAARRRGRRGQRHRDPRAARPSWSRPGTRAAARARPRTRPAGCGAGRWRRPTVSAAADATNRRQGRPAMIYTSRHALVRRTRTRVPTGPLGRSLRCRAAALPPTPAGRLRRCRMRPPRAIGPSSSAPTPALAGWRGRFTGSTPRTGRGRTARLPRPRRGAEVLAAVQPGPEPPASSRTHNCAGLGGRTLRLPWGRRATAAGRRRGTGIVAQLPRVRGQTPGLPPLAERQLHVSGGAGAPTVALATLLRDQPLSTRKTSFALERGRLTGRPSAPAPGCSARPRSARRTPPADRARTATPPTASA